MKITIYNSAIIREPRVLNLEILREKKMPGKGPIFSNKQTPEIFRVTVLYLIQSCSALF